MHPPETPPETPLDDKTLETLEFPLVLERLARHTAFSAGRQAALALRPVSDRETVVRRQRETAEAVQLDRIGAEVPLGGAHDVRALARNAERGQTLSASEMMQVAATVRASQGAQRALARLSSEAPLLATVAGRIAALGPVRIVIEEALDDRGEVIDSASPELRAIRRERGEVHERLQQRMQAMLNSPPIRAALQDAIVTLRDGRYVLPVRSEARGAVRGVVHDSSASGATIFVEPMAVVDLGNRWRELQAQERHEVERILREISAAIGEAAADLVDAVERLAQIDVALAKARLAKALDAQALAQPGVDQPWLVDAPSELRLVEARHPLLEGEVVPVTIACGDGYRALLITGPNTGGKTVALKTAGLLCAMALAGLPVPAQEGTQVPVYEQLFADIGDEQSIEQSLSTFSGHMTAIIDIIERAGPRSLVLLDELGAGTDPAEGGALAIAIVDRLVAAGATLIATTHHAELKLYAHQSDAVMNASVEFDVETLSPTYHLRIGLPGQSNALAIASGLGMPPDVVEQARAGVSTDEREMEALLGELRSQLTAAEERAEHAASDRDEAERVRAELEGQLRALVADSDQMREQARERVHAEVRDAERLLERMRRRVEAARLEQAAADLQRAREAAAALEPDVEDGERPSGEQPPAVAAAPPVPDVELRTGRAVWLRGIPLPGEVLTEPDESGEFDVQLGALRTRARVQQVERVDARSPAAVPAGTAPPPPPVADEIEVRGQRVDEALPAIEQYLDRAARAGRSRVRLIHGRGTGTLRRAVRELLERHPLVSRFETADSREGGEGVTVAFLVGTQ